MKKLFNITCLFFLIFSLAASISAKLLFGPYHNNATRSSIKILWVTDNKKNPGHIRIKGIKKEHIPEVTLVADGKGYLQTVTIPGLKHTKYYTYTLHYNKQEIKGKFRTLAEKRSKYSFVIYGDTRTHADKHKKISDLIASENPEFVVLSGDLVANGDKWDLWKKEFFDPASIFLKKTVLWPALGNHEGSGKIYLSLFDLPGNEKYYSFDYSNLHVVILDSVLSDKNEMIRWLKEDLKKNKKLWTIVSYHHPTYNIGGHHSDWGRKDILPVLEKYGVDLVITGHSHLYERFRPIGPQNKKPIIHIVSGGGGAPLYSPEKSPLLAQGTGFDVYHYCFFTIHKNKLTVKVKDIEKKVIDSFELIKKNNTYQKEVLKDAVTHDEANIYLSLSSQIRCEFAKKPVAGRKTVISMDKNIFSHDSTLILEKSKSRDKWQCEEQKRIINEINEDRISFTVTAPNDLVIEWDRILPEFDFSLSLLFDTKKYQIEDFKTSPYDIYREIRGYEPDSYFPYTGSDIVLDGKNSDWKGIDFLSMPYMKNKKSHLKFCWNKKGVWGMAEFPDEECQINVGSPWRADTIEVFIEKDLQRAGSMHSNSIQYFIIPTEDMDPANIIWSSHQQNNNPNIKAICKRNKKGYIVEFLLSSQELAPAVMKKGTKIGFNAAISDNGEPVEQLYMDKNRNSSWGKPISWGIIELK